MSRVLGTNSAWTSATRTGPSPLDLSEFRSAVSSSFVPLAVQSDAPSAFSGTIVEKSAGRLIFAEICANAHSVDRTPDLIANGGGGYYKLSIMLAGTGLLVQDDREMLLRPGGVTIYDTGRPYTLVFEDGFRNFVVMVPKNAIDLPADLVGELTAAVNLGNSQMGRMVSQFLVQAPKVLTQPAGPVENHIARSATELLETLLISTLGTERIEQDPHQALMRRIRGFIDQNLGQPGLTPNMIADAHYISARHLYGLFRQQDLTVSTYIRNRRLERCRDDLLNPTFADRQVSAIAARWGFGDAAHFSRVFRSYFNESPSALRVRNPRQS